MSEPIDLVLQRLDKPREVAPGRWRARCPAHDGKSGSTLSLTRADDGRVLLHCFSGCEVAQVVASMGLQLHELFTPSPAEHRATAPRSPFVPAQVFDVARHEVAVASVIASDMNQRRDINATDYARLRTAAERLEDIARGAYGRK